MTEPLEIHTQEQLFAAIREMSAMLAAHYRGLREAGLSVEEAIELTKARQTDMMFGSQEGDE